jgi:CBS domain-containing protein
MSNSRYHELLLRAGDQHGVVSRRDMIDIGVPASTVTSAVRSGRFATPQPGIYVVVGSPETQLQRLMIAVLSLPALAAVSHDSAAELWSLAHRGIRRIHVVTTRWDRVGRPGVAVHESLDLIPSDVVVHRGVPVTTAQRTVVDLGASNKWIVESALEEGIRRGLFTLQDVEQVVERVGRKGRRGVGVIRPLIDARREWDTASESALEDMFLKVVAELELPAPRAQYVVRSASDVFVCRADFAYPRHRILIELDSEAHHMDRLTFRRDRSKQNQAVALGWTVLRFTWWDLVNDSCHVGAQIRAVLAARSRPA